MKCKRAQKTPNRVRFSCARGYRVNYAKNAKRSLIRGILSNERISAQEKGRRIRCILHTL